jgi:beta-barrel assembly-enhancing protease
MGTRLSYKADCALCFKPRSAPGPASWRPCTDPVAGTGRHLTSPELPIRSACYCELPVPVFRFLVVALLAFALNAPAAHAQQNLPSLGEAGADELPPSTERRLGEQIMLEVRRDASYLQDGETTEYLNNLGYRLVAVSPSRSLDFVFFAIRDPMLNAFALPGGFIGVHTGLVIAAQSESELAGVLAHEIGHVTQRHIARMIARQRESTAMAIGALLLAILASRAGGSSGGDLAQAAIMGSQAAMIQQQLNFSREAEREADRVGFQTLLDAGFDGRGMESFFARLQAGTRIYEGTAPAYLRTHPMTVERISDMQNRTRSLRFTQRPDSLEFQLVRARLRVVQENTTQGWRDALEHFNGQLVNRTTHSEVAARYGATVAALRLNMAEVALQNAQAARRLAPGGSAMLDKALAEARFAAARTDAERADAVTLAQETAAKYPLSPLTAHHYVELLFKTERYDDAISYLRGQQAITRNQPAYHALLGRAYETLNRRSLHHQAVSEMYALLGATAPAIQQLELAKRANDGDFFTMSEIDARLRDLRVDFKREQDEMREASGRRGPDGGRSSR